MLSNLAWDIHITDMKNVEPSLMFKAYLPVLRLIAHISYIFLPLIPHLVWNHESPCSAATHLGWGRWVWVGNGLGRPSRRIKCAGLLGNSSSWIQGLWLNASFVSMRLLKCLDDTSTYGNTVQKVYNTAFIYFLVYTCMYHYVLCVHVLVQRTHRWHVMLLEDLYCYKHL